MTKTDVAIGALFTAAVSMIILSAILSSPNNPIWTDRSTGVHITHNGQPVAELYVEVLCGGSCTSSSPIISGSTDSQGIFTFRPAPFSTGFLYRVTFDGQTYGIKGAAEAIVDDPI